MRIACPDCGAAYDVPADRVPPGRGVRCAKCGVVWTPVATVDAEPAIVPAPEAPVRAGQPAVPEPIPVADLAEPVPFEAPTPVRPAFERPIEVAPAQASDAPEPVRGRALVTLGWLLSFAVLGALGWLAVTRRADVMHAWPPSERAYALLRLVP